MATKAEYKIVKIRDENISNVISGIKKIHKNFKNSLIFGSDYICISSDTPESVINRLQKYKSIKVPKFVYDKIVMLRNDLIRMGYDNWLPHIKRAMKHRLNPTTRKLTNYRSVTIGDIVNLTFVHLRFELNRDSGMDLVKKVMSSIIK